jgi:hypothetical protein
MHKNVSENEEKGPLVIPGYRWADNIKVDLK